LDGAKPVRCNYNDIGIYCWITDFFVL
jgi:hypothetical protein